MSLQLDFSNLPLSLDERFKVLLDLTINEAPDDVASFEWVMSFPDDSSVPKDVFLVHALRIQLGAFVISKVYCLKESPDKSYVWAYITGADAQCSTLKLQYCDKALSLPELIDYWQQRVLADIDQHGYDIALQPDVVSEVVADAKHLIQQ